MDPIHETIESFVPGRTNKILVFRRALVRNGRQQHTRFTTEWNSRRYNVCEATRDRNTYVDKSLPLQLSILVI